MTRTYHARWPNFLCIARAPARAHARANDDCGTQFQTKWQRHACVSQRARICSRQDDAHTQTGRRTWPCDAPKRACMSTAGAAGGRRAQCEADGQERACCGSRACMGDGFGDPAALGVRGGKDWATHHPNCNLMATSLSRQLSRGKSSHLVVLRSNPCTTARSYH